MEILLSVLHIGTIIYFLMQVLLLGAMEMAELLVPSILIIVCMEQVAMMRLAKKCIH